MDGSQYLLNCTNLTVSQLQELEIIRGVSGFVCMIIVVVAFVVLLRYYVVYESHRTVLQRMVLIFMAVTILVQALLAAQFEHYFSYNGQSEVCAVIGFLNQWMSSLSYTFTFGITLYLLYIVYVKLRRPPRHSDINKRSPYFRPIVEGIFYLIVIFSPFLFLWIPFLANGYGLDVAFCWIKTIEKKECMQTNHFVANSFLAISVLVQGLSLLCVFIVATISCVAVKKYERVNSRPLQSLFCRTLCIMGILVSSSLIAIVERVILIAIHNPNTYSTWSFLAVFIPISYVIVPLGLLVYACTIKKKRRQNVASCLTMTSCLRKRRSHQCINQLSEGSQTHPESENNYVPSHTHWNVSYTNGFTSVERGDSEQVGLTGFVCGSTLVSSDVGYSSITPSP